MKPITDFLSGLNYILKGIGYFLKNIKLWKYIAIPFSLNILLLACLITLLYFYLGDMTSFFQDKIGLELGTYTGAVWYAKIGIFFVNMFVYIIKFLLGIIIVVLSGIVFFIVSQIVSAPFYDALCERIEELYTRGVIQDVSIWQAIKDIPKIVIVEIQKLTILLMIPLALLVFNVVPGIGNILYLIVAGAFTSASYGAGFVDYIQAVKRQKFFERFRFARKHFFLLMGFGVPALIPFVNLFITPLMVTGGTLLYLDKSRG